MYVQWIIAVHSCNNCCGSKTIRFRNSECLCVWNVSYQECKVHAPWYIAFVASSSLQHSSTLSHKRHDFGKGTLLNIKCVFWFSLQLLCETLLILKETEQDISLLVYRLSDFYETRISWADFRKILKYRIFLWKSVQWETHFFRADGRSFTRQKDMRKLIDALRKLPNALNKKNLNQIIMFLPVPCS